MNIASLVKSVHLVFLLAEIMNCASINQAEEDGQQHEHAHDDLIDTPHEHPHKHQLSKPVKNNQEKWRVLRKKKKAGFDAINKERDWDGFYDSDSDFNDIDIDNVEMEWRDYPYQSEEVIEYHSHSHDHPHHGHGISSVYNKYDDLRPLDLTKLVPMVSLLGLYLLTPTFLHARKKRDNFHIFADGVGLGEEDKKLECFLRLACRVGELSKEIGVHSNPLIAELMENKKFAQTVKKYREENQCNTSGCEEILTF